ncbi:MAG: hypothetical protein CM1200mP10_24770 [Candidatus Neomarinimicrobiota bacterium]|nr:MAG: hypothetical protein CM1200mP10_24770 [Candidatus Neomarinimicrobiota bacterium]
MTWGIYSKATRLCKIFSWWFGYTITVSRNGNLPGVELRLVKIAPLGGTIELKVRNYYVSIRQQDALNIVIEN